MSQVWLITGSGRGFGRSLASAVLAAGHQLVATARDTSQLQDLVGEYGDLVRTVALDVTGPGAARNAVQAAVDSFGRLDVVVNNAGYANVAPLETVDPADFRTDWGGSSMQIQDFGPDYDQTVGTLARHLRDVTGTEPGDPDRAAQVILKVAAMDEPPLRLLLGASAYRTGQLVSQQRLADDQKWRHLSEEADFPGQLDIRGGDIALHK
jgi:hypothetical protein